MVSGPRERHADARRLADFERTAALVWHFVASEIGDDDAERLHVLARRHYEAILPRVPTIPGLRASVLNTFLHVTAQEVAVYLAMRDLGRTPPEAWAICHEAIRVRMASYPRWKRWLAGRLMFSRLVRRVMRRREARGERGRFGDFELRYRAGDGRDFDIGVDYLRCGNYELAKRLGAAEFAPFVCLSDMALSDALGWGLQRSQTLADGCAYCDFRFKRGAPTHIRSRTPAVQAAIDRIEAQQPPAGLA